MNADNRSDADEEQQNLGLSMSLDLWVSHTFISLFIT